ncbi:MAG TPA: fumarylacetoacetate hydrolase family protein [Candidatus Saccharimonadales bacterium]|nr:fumarylacetoacetate hydrolase family protein [Candidatus Saccharimonadales bacterium]
MSDVTMDEAALVDAAQRLATAERTRQPIDPLSTTHPAITPADAYAIQQRWTARRVSDGESIVGWKLGLTSLAMQTQLGVDQPDYGPILSGWSLPDGAVIAASELIAPRIEAEVAFILDRPLRGPGVTADEARRATRAVAPALEVIDSRIRDWKIHLPDTVADLASCARVIVGPARVPIDGSFDLRLVGAVLEKDGTVVATGAGAAALGDPAAAVAWAANTLGELGVTLEAGHVIMTGALHASVPVAAGDTFSASIDRLGSVGVRFG